MFIMRPTFAPLLFMLIWGSVTHAYVTYEVTNVKSVWSSYMDNPEKLTLQNVINGTIKERHKRGAVGDVIDAAGDAAAGAAGGWGAGLGKVLDIAGKFANIAGPAAQIFSVIQGFKQLSLQREQMRIQQRQFEEQMALRTTELCVNMCVNSWEPWTACSVACGGGSATRKREPFPSDLCKDQPCPHHLQETGVCNNRCANQGIPSGTGSCDCPRGFNGPCCNNEIICDFPGKPQFGHLEGPIPAKFGGVVSFACSDGFALVGDEARVCKANSQWGGTQPVCEKIECAEPDEPARGQNLNKKATYQYGEEVFYRCNSGYVLTGPEKRQCTTYNGGSEGLWTSFAPLCLPINCHDPGYPLNGNAQGTEFTLGNQVTFSCNTGFRLIGSETRTCRASGRWSGHEARCELMSCDPPFIPKNGAIRRPREVYRFGIQIQYECEEGYTMEGESLSVCEEDTVLSHLGPGGAWSNEAPICKPTKCGNPGEIENGARDGSLLYYPNNVTYLCFDGYILQGAPLLHCGYNGVWSSPAPTCLACDENSFRNNQGGDAGCTSCPENTHTVTEASTNVRQCVCNDGYTGPPGGPCTEIVCEALQAPANGQMTCEGNKYMNKCDFSCDAGYILDKGSSRRTCQENAAWTGTKAQCTACPLDTFKSDEKSCLPCPTNSRTQDVASDKTGCLCTAGYEGPAGGPCADKNECTANGGKGDCEDSCRNLVGSYACECMIPGYIVDPLDKHACKLEKSCRNLTESDAPDNGGLVCHWYREENSQQCSVKCNKGYEFPSRINNYESCGTTTGFMWSHEERGDVFEPCVEEFFPGVTLEGESSYFVRNCRDLTEEEKEKVKVDFAQMLTDEGICVRSASKVCEAANVGIICGATRRRRRGTDTIDNVNFQFELAAKMLTPSDCDKICPMLRIPEHRCEALCVTTYRRFLLALMRFTKRSMENLFTNPRKVSFRSGAHAFLYSRNSLKTSDVIVGCPTGMEMDDICIPCTPGSFLSQSTNNCTECPSHTFQAHPQQTKCNQCPIGTYAPSAGSAYCMPCPEDKWGPQCARRCRCEHGQCDSTNGKCICYSGWEGDQCNIDTQGCTVDSCYPGVSCQDVPAPGTGFKCGPCPAGLQGDGTICDSGSGRKKRAIAEQFAEHNIAQIGSLKSLSSLSTGL